MVVVASAALIGPLQPAATAVEGSTATDSNAVAVPAFPYVAEITGDDVYIRSGPGTNYYACGKLQKGERVTVVNQQFSWSCIVPPAASFSWIYVPYVSIDPDNPDTGIVTGDNVRVYAGSDQVKPIHSTLQLKLNRGEKVKLLGEEKDNYYKIAAPTGAYLWVSTQFTRPIARTAARKPVVEVVGPNEPSDGNEVVVEPAAAKLKEFRELQKRIAAERSKPIEQQNYAEIRAALEELAKDKEAGKAARYCEFALRQVERYELAVAVSKELSLQNKQLHQTQDKIERARSMRLAQLRELGRFAVIGRLRSSIIYGSAPELRHYRIVDESGKTICYARPTGEALNKDFSGLVGRKVGLVGQIVPHPTTGGALVKFTELEEIQ